MTGKLIEEVFTWTCENCGGVYGDFEDHVIQPHEVPKVWRNIKVDQNGVPYTEYFCSHCNSESVISPQGFTTEIGERGGIE